MNKQYAYFNELPTKAEFNMNGIVYKKRSTRTADIVRPEIYAGQWYYIGKKDMCVVNSHSRLEENYHVRN